MLKGFWPARLFVTFLLIIAVSVVAFADTLRLKDGSIIKGRITAFGGGKFTVVVGEGARQRQMTFDASEVESIEFDAASPRTSNVSAVQRPVPEKQEPEFIETAAQQRKTSPRVVTTDMTTEAVKQPPARTVQLPPVIEKSEGNARKPIEVTVKVLADNTANGWTNSGWIVRKGQKIRIIGGGSITLGGGRSTGPSGLYDLEDAGKLLKSVPTGALIAVVGDDNNEFIYVGSERTFTATRDGALFLGVNEGNLDDNSGAFDVRIEIEPA